MASAVGVTTTIERLGEDLLLGLRYPWHMTQGKRRSIGMGLDWPVSLRENVEWFLWLW